MAGEDRSKASTANHDIVERLCIWINATVHAAKCFIETVANITPRNIQAEICSLRRWAAHRHSFLRGWTDDCGLRCESLSKTDKEESLKLSRPRILYPLRFFATGMEVPKFSQFGTNRDKGWHS